LPTSRRIVTASELRSDFSRTDMVATLSTCSVTSRINATSFNGVPIHELGQEALVEAVLTMRECGHSHVIHFLATHPLTIARRDRAFADILRKAQINVPDGLPLVWAIRAIGGRASRITAADGLSLLCAATTDARIGHFFFGSSAFALARLRENLTASHPGLQIVGVQAPPFRPLSDSDIAASADDVRAVGTDILWIGMGAPKQNFIAEQFRDHQAASVIITIGAAFDFAASVKQRAPRWMQRAGLEWLFRMLQEPRRLGPRYVVGNSRFLIDAARATWMARASSKRSSH
jgi:N-acetylglucosaminyldiphosphoundecaprenol N-acetyl-beta-D-mannosaminyltransferase